MQHRIRARLVTNVTWARPPDSLLLGDTVRLGSVALGLGRALGARNLYVNNNKQFIYTWQGRYHDHRGVFPRVRLIRCTLGCADPCDFPKCGNLNCIICGSGG